MPHENIKNYLKDKYAKIETVAISFAMMCAASFYSEHSGHSEKMPQPFRAVWESACHPAVGLAGAVAGYIIADKFFDTGATSKIAAGLAGATAVNFAVEKFQDIYFHPALPFYNQVHQIESAKDLGAALVGGVAGLYLLNNGERPSE